MPYIEVIAKYAVFGGRATRTEFWLFQAIHLPILIGLNILASVNGSWLFLALAGIYVLATFLPSLAVSVRRLHDTGRRAWWLLLVFVPFGIGHLVLLIFFLMGSDEENRYGPEPL